MTSDLKSRLAASVLIGTGAGILSALSRRFFISLPGGGDFSLALVSAKELILGHNPYPPSIHAIPYPLPASIVSIPLAPLSGAVAGGIFFGLSSFLLAFGLSRTGWIKLWLFASFPFTAAMVCTQWSPLAVAAVFFPWIGIAAFKPQLGISSAIASRDWRSVLVPALLLFLSLAIRPTWITEWLGLARGYPWFVPLALSPGWLLVILLPLVKRRDTQILLAAAISPQRWFYDPLILWLIPESEKEYLLANCMSWIGAVVWFLFMPEVAYSTVWLLMVCTLYCPMLLIVIRRQFAHQHTKVCETSPPPLLGADTVIEND